MSESESESDPNPGNDAQDRRARPVVPGWNADWYAGPSYDDTGWQIDLSRVDWNDDAGRDRQPRQPSRPETPADDSHHQERTGNDPGPAGLDWTAAVRAQGRRAGRAAGRPARHARPGAEPPQDGGSRPEASRQEAPRSPVWEEPSSAVRPDQHRRPGRSDPHGLPPDAPVSGRPRQRRPQPGGPRPEGYRPDGSRPDGSQQSGPRQARTGPAAARRRDGDTSASIVRSSGVMAVGTIASRLTGFLRTLAQAFALGGAVLSVAYNTANTLPNVVYNLALGGILTSVIVPLIVNAARRDTDGGEGYDQRMFTLITFALLGITVIATIAAAPIADLYKGGISDSNGSNQLHLMIVFAYFFIPQIFFYGMSSLISAILNARGSFAAPMWTPVVNNFVVIAILGLYMAMVAGHHPNPSAVTTGHIPISSGEVALLGIGTTIGIVAQTVALLPAMRRVGFRWRPRYDFRRSEAREIGRMAGWMLCYVGATQVAFLVTTNIANTASPGTGFTAYTYAWQLFQMPYAVVGISVITALLPRMSVHAAERRFGLVRQDFSAGVRLASAIVVPSSLVLAVLGAPLAKVLFRHGHFTAVQAHATGLVFAAFCLGLLPYMLFQLQLRVFYSLHDSRTPALIGLATMVTNIAANYIALVTLRGSTVVVGLGAGFGLANLMGTVLAWRILSRRLRGLDGWLIGRSLVRMHAAALPAALIAVVVGLISGNAYVTVIIGGGLAAAMYLLFARALRIDELSSLTRAVMSRLGR